MKLSYKQFGKYVDLSDYTLAKLAEALTTAGFEVEDILPAACGSKLVIGQVNECTAHPDSDHLHVCQVNTGEKVIQIVCGAPNVAAGQKVIVALPGCMLPNGEIKSGIVRGQNSDGMICALFELGVDKKTLTEQQLNGIEVLPDDAVIGNTDVLGYLNLDDTILDVALTPNRADCLSWWAMAKEIGAIINKPVKLPDYHIESHEIPASLNVTTETAKCPVFYGKVINKVTIGPSPLWLQQALQSVGIKVINNVVDISNFVMMETGQPLHFYDVNKIRARQITVVDGLSEKYEALDGLIYDIQPQDIMITSQGQTIGIAGIMGGEDSKIDDKTTGIIIEAAAFSSSAIRSTARRLNLETEACQHFEKGIEPLAPVKAVARSVQLLTELAAAEGIEQTVIAGTNSYQPLSIDLKLAKVNSVLATHFSMAEIIQPLKQLDFNPVIADDQTVRCDIPSYRTDIRIQEDLIEEIIRLKGYDNIVSSLPVMPTVAATYAPDGRLLRIVSQMLNGWGFNEVVTYSLTNQTADETGIYSIGTPVTIANPASDQRRIYRTSLLPSLLEVVSYNQAHFINDIAIFETANVYDNNNNSSKRIALVQTKQTTVSRWQKEVLSNDFYAMKGYLTAIMDKLGYEEKRLSFTTDDKPRSLLHPYQYAIVNLDKKPVGIFGTINPIYAQQHNLSDLVMAEIDFTAIMAAKPARVRYTAVSKYPAVCYDVAMIVSRSVSAEKIISVIRKAGGKLVVNTEIFDVYQGLGISPLEKSVAVSITYQSAQSTLAEKDILPVHNAIIDALKHQLKAVIRDSK